MFSFFKNLIRNPMMENLIRKWTVSFVWCPWPSMSVAVTPSYRGPWPWMSRGMIFGHQLKTLIWSCPTQLHVAWRSPKIQSRFLSIATTTNSPRGLGWGTLQILRDKRVPGWNKVMMMSSIIWKEVGCLMTWATRIWSLQIVRERNITYHNNNNSYNINIKIFREDMMMGNYQDDISYAQPWSVEQTWEET